jgi:hypothetical protein
VLWPLTDIGATTSAVAAAAVHHPVAFPRNFLKFKSAVEQGDWENAGKYLGKDVHYVLDEFDDEDGDFPEMIAY